MHFAASRKIRSAHGGWIGLAAALAASAPLACAAQSYPERPVRMVLSFGAPGGTPDTLARVIGPKLTEMWGKQVVIDPRSGASVSGAIYQDHTCSFGCRGGVRPADDESSFNPR